MNMLLDSVPDSLCIAGTEYKINTDFRTWINFEMLLSGCIDDSDQAMLDIKKSVFKERIPPAELDEETSEQIIWFYRCGKEQASVSSGSGKEIFSYDYDDGYIIAAFMEQYHINLNTSSLHWWVFRALMLSLSESTELVKIMGYRAIEINSKMSAEQKAFYQKMKKHYKLPIKKELKEQYSRLEDAIINGEDIDSLL